MNIPIERPYMTCYLMALLLEALEKRFGIPGMALTWYRSYLTERNQTFQVGRERPTTFVVSCSVPQSSVLGPLKFIAYTEVLPAVIEKRSVDPYLNAMTVNSTSTFRIRKRCTSEYGDLCWQCSKLVPVKAPTT